MFCPSCGAQVAEGATFCAQCGNRLTATPPPPESTTAPASPAASTVPPPASAPGTVPMQNARKPRRVAMFILGPILFVIGLIVLWGMLNAVADPENPSEFVLFFNNVLVPLLLALSIFAIPIGVVFAIVTNSRDYDGTIRCGNCHYMGMGKRGRSVWAQVLIWIVFFFFWPATLIYYLVTHSYECPKCGSTFVGLRHRDGSYSAPSGGGAGPFVIVLLVFVFIAIIGILAAVVLASLNAAREKGQDAATESLLETMRTEAALYESSTGSFVGFCDSPKITETMRKIVSGSPSNHTCNDAEGSFAISAELNEDGYYCVDSEGSGYRTDMSLKENTACTRSTKSLKSLSDELIRDGATQ